MTVYPNHYSAVFAAAQPDCFKKFEVTVDDSTPRVPARAAVAPVPSENPTAYSPTVEATLTIEVKKPTEASAVQWIFEGIEYAHAPIAGELCDQHVGSNRPLIRKTGLVFSEPKTFLPGETYKFPISFTMPADSLPSHRSEYAGIRYSLGAALTRPNRTDTAWYKPHVSKERKIARCESIVYIGSLATKLPPPCPVRSFAHVGSSTVAITAPSYLILNEDSRVAQTIKIELSVVAGSAQLTSASLELREFIPSGYRAQNRVHGAVLDAVLATDLQSAGRFDMSRLLLQSEPTDFPAPSSTATIPVEIPAGAYMVWHDDIDTGAEGFVKCSHWFDLVIKGTENGNKCKGKAVVPIAIHGAWSCTVRDMFYYWEA
ncbi:hypothetical protein BDZ88DRAFT_410142 [Geranomyces variabilis]|nr:hypothetical protein BDZ88DRAFT_410142 [Geranomyces variabilis]KAJ3133244.1 hypothetical protein HDU90_006401 [Geranomyces variabilis]